MKQILLVPGLILAAVALPFILAGSIYVLAWKSHRLEREEA